MDKAYIARCLRFGDSVYVIGDIISVTYMDEHGTSSNVKGRLHYIGDVHIKIDNSEKYNNNIVGIASYDITHITDLSIRGDE